MLNSESDIKLVLNRLIVVLTLLIVSALTAEADFEAAEKAYDQGDFATALREFKADGSPRSLNNVGMIYFNGEGVDQDKREALRWFRKAAEAGNVKRR